LSKEEKTRSEIIANLVEMYKCNLHFTPCFIQDGRHLQLNPSRLQLWARDIVCKIYIIFMNSNKYNTYYFLFR
jgi:hypothetical protein